MLRASTRILWDDTVTSSVCRRGEYVGEFICQNSGLAEETFLDLLENGFEPRGVASVTSKPVAAVHDLLYRLLVEGGACPDWSKIENKGWQDVSSAGPTAAAWMFGPTPELYEDCAFAWWGPESAGSWFVTDSPCALVLFQTGGEKEAKALLPVLRKKVEERKELAQDGLDVLAFNEVENKDEIDKLNRLLEGLENAQVMQSGRYAALLMCDDPAQTAIALPRFAASCGGTSRAAARRRERRIPITPTGSCSPRPMRRICPSTTRPPSWPPGRKAVRRGFPRTTGKSMTRQRKSWTGLSPRA